MSQMLHNISKECHRVKLIPNSVMLSSIEWICVWQTHPNNTLDSPICDPVRNNNVQHHFYVIHSFIHSQMTFIKQVMQTVPPTFHHTENNAIQFENATQIQQHQHSQYHHLDSEQTNNNDELIHQQTPTTTTLTRNKHTYKQSITISKFTFLIIITTNVNRFSKCDFRTRNKI